MPRVSTNLRATPGLFKKWRHEALYNEGFCLDIWTTWGYFELLCLSSECAFIKIRSDPNPSKTTQNCSVRNIYRLYVMVIGLSGVQFGL